jgi:hypothetical protein
VSRFIDKKLFSDLAILRAQRNYMTKKEAR